MFGEDGAAFLYRGHDRGEVVVGEHDVGGFLQHIGAGDSHRHADVGAHQRRRIVRPVAGHGDDRPVRVQRLHDAQLVLGIDPRASWT